MCAWSPHRKIFLLWQWNFIRWCVTHHQSDDTYLCWKRSNIRSGKCASEQLRMDWQHNAAEYKGNGFRDDEINHILTMMVSGSFLVLSIGRCIIFWPKKRRSTPSDPWVILASRHWSWNFIVGWPLVFLFVMPINLPFLGGRFSLVDWDSPFVLGCYTDISFFGTFFSLRRKGSGSASWHARLRVVRLPCRSRRNVSSDLATNSLICHEIWGFLHPIGSMYAIYGNIYHQYTPNIPKC